MIRKKDLLNALLDERRRAERRELELLDTILRLSNRGAILTPTYEEAVAEPEEDYYSALEQMDGA